MKEYGLVNAVITMNDAQQKIAWISSEYAKMFPTDPADIDMVSDNDRFHCAVLLTRLHSLVDELKFLSEMTNIPKSSLTSHNKVIKQLNSKLLKVVTEDYREIYKEKNVML
ncbi:MAG: hypothetical protein IKA36_05475 [Clostridia bacterium]|nr:hypothetical protein [Clostridia bacterium]